MTLLNLNLKLYNKNKPGVESMAGISLIQSDCYKRENYYQVHFISAYYNGDKDTRGLLKIKDTTSIREGTTSTDL